MSPLIKIAIQKALERESKGSIKRAFLFANARKVKTVTFKCFPLD